jgi:glucose/arabinose dehydrogenase
VTQTEPSTPARRTRALIGLGVLLVLLLVLAGGIGRRFLPFVRQHGPALKRATAVGAGPRAGLGVVRAFPKLSFTRPVFLTHAPGDDRLYVVEQAGRVLRFRPDPEVDQAEVALDISDRVSRKGNEEGLIGFTFHPRFPEDPRLFVHYSASQGERRGVISTFRVADGEIDPRSEEVLLEVPQPYGNHNGGMLAFGPDGHLYIGLGDGGWAGDPERNGLDPTTLLGSILRIDADRQDGERPYGIPADNPFASGEGGAPEVWAYGLRNPWRFSFDRATGELWAGDVGQNAWEEVNLVEAGGNYGWRAREGFVVYDPSESPPGPLRDPVAAYGRGEGISITGGYVYRGKRWPDLVGWYLYADFGSGAIWALRRGVTSPEQDPQRHPAAPDVRVEKLLASGPNVASFGEGPDGELYLCTWEGLFTLALPEGAPR